LSHREWTAIGLIAVAGTALAAWYHSAAALLLVPLGVGALAMARRYYRRGRAVVMRDDHGPFIEAVPIGLGRIGLDGRIQSANLALQQFLGAGAAELCSKTLADLTYPEDLDSDSTHWRELLEGRRDACQLETRFLHARGYLLWARVVLSLVRDEHGQPRYFAAVV
jgi:PAS domain S-box-containing protein